jgi:hypothetical protein
VQRLVDVQTDIGVVAENKSIRGDSKKEDNQMQGKLEEKDEYENLGDGELEGLLADNKS